MRIFPLLISPLLLVLAGGLSAQSPVAQPATCTSEVQTAEVNGATLHYLECGEGEPLVFVHGALSDLHTFDGQIAAFAEEFRVIAYSRRFHPPNAPPQAGDAYAMQLHVDDLAALVRQLEVGPAHIVGHSYGAYTALALALEHPELVRSLVLGEPPVFSLLSHTSVGGALGESFKRRVSDPSRSAFESGDSEDGLRRFLDGVGVLPGFDQLPQPVRAKFMEKAPEFRLEQLTEGSAYMSFFTCEAMGQLEPPVILVTGEQTAALFLLITAELERCLEGESHVMVPDVGHELGHGAMSPEFYNEAVLSFVRGH